MASSQRWPAYHSPCTPSDSLSKGYNSRRNVEALAEPVHTIIDPSITEPTQRSQVVVYVDKYGAPARTATEVVQVLPAATEAPGTEVPAAEAPAPAAESSAPQSPSDEAANPAIEGLSAGNNSSTSGGSRMLPGIAYAPYSAGGECKTQEMIEDDFAHFMNKYSLVRIYGTDCDQVSKVHPVAKKNGLKLFLGLFELEGIEQQVQHIVDSVGSDWDVIDTVSVGNELVNNGQAKTSQVLGAMSKAKSLLRGAGFQGPVVNVDTFVAVLDNPELCDESDYCAMNVHPFFDGNVDASEAGDFVARMVTAVRAKLSDPSKRIVVTETGWPWQGANNRVAHPGRNAQHDAIDSIKAAFANDPEDLILFSAFNDPWKPAESNTFFAEQYWGIDGLDSAY